MECLCFILILIVLTIVSQNVLDITPFVSVTVIDLRNLWLFPLKVIHLMSFIINPLNLKVSYIDHMESIY